MTEHELSILEELLNEAIKEYFDSGYSIKDEYIKTLRCILKRFNLKEYYNYDELEDKRCQKQQRS